MGSESGINSRFKSELIKNIYDSKDKDLLDFLTKHLKVGEKNLTLKDLSTEDRIVLKARLVEIECTYDRFPVINIIAIAFFAFLIAYKEMVKELLFRDNTAMSHFFMVGIYIFITLFFANLSIKSKKLQANAKYFLAIIDSIEKNFLN